MNLTPKESALTRELVEAGYGWTRPIIPRLAFTDCPDANTRRLMLHGLARKGVLLTHESEMNGTIFIVADAGRDHVRQLKEAEQREREAKLDREARDLLMRALYEHGHQLRCVRSDGWRSQVRRVWIEERIRASYSSFGRGRRGAALTEEYSTESGLLYQMSTFAPLRLWQVV